MDAIVVALPALLFSSLSALPLAIGLLVAVRHLRAGRRADYLRHLIASTAAGAVALALLWGSLFGNDLSRSSTAGLIFAIAPVYALLAQAIAYGVAAAVFRRAGSSQPVALSARLPLLLPLLLLVVLAAGLIRVAGEGNELTVAERASNPDTLRRLYEKSRTGQADAFGVPLFLAQNHNAPPDVLREIASDAHPTIRAQVARNPRTPTEVVAALRNDCASYVREIAEERLGPDQALSPNTPRTGVCPPQRPR